MTHAPEHVPTSARTLFHASRPLTILEHFRTPYEIDAKPGDDGVGRIGLHGGGPSLLWPAAIDAPAVAATLLAGEAEAGIPIFARVLPDRLAETVLAAHGGGWTAARALLGADGTRLGSVWRCDDGSVLLPFDPDEVMTGYWSERYATIAGGAASRSLKRALMIGYYRVRWLLPRALQIWLRRRFARLQARSRFPRWPAETGLHDFFDFFFAVLAEIAGQRVPRIAAWPGNYSWALVLTHDVELASGAAALAPVLELERRLGLRSSWNFVPRRYAVDADRLRDLEADGFEVGVHGLYHDGRDLESLATLGERLPGIREAAERWGAVGFRSPATHRRWEWMPLLGFDYDTSYPDTDPFEPQAGGCCTWLPFFNGELVELPLTLAQDYTLFTILRQRDETIWIEKAELVRARGGMALIDTHPDYLVDEVVMRAYRRFLERFAADASAWKPLPREVSSWWRRRGASRLEHRDGAWTVIGPAAAEASVELVDGAW